MEMVKINLAKALKNKNRLIGEIKSLQGIIVRDNSQKVGSPPKKDVNEIVKKMNLLIDKLIDLKSKITTANIGIYHAIAEMSECKSLMDFYRSIPTRDGEEIEHDMYGRGEAMTVTYEAVIKITNVDEICERLQQRINNLQDEIDSYNGSTFIEIDE